MTETELGQVLALEVGAVAHGGHCVARADDGRVVFVRHTLPGERVRAEVTEERTGYLRADAIEILRASPDRVTPPCRYAGPDLCGGCDFQHVSPAAQRDLKTAVVVEQLTRLARLNEHEIDALGVRVEPLPGGPLGWRTRLQYSIDSTGRAGLLKHRSHEVVAVDECAIATPGVAAQSVTSEVWPDDDEVQVVESGIGEVTVLAGSAGRTPHLVSGPPKITEVVGEREWRLDPAAFWQVHPDAAATFVGVAMDLLAPAPGEHAWDLYGGAGIFAAALAERVGSGGSVTLVESDHRALASAAASLADLPWITYVKSKVERVRLRVRPDVVVLDPPRSGAGAKVVTMLVEAAPRAIAYVACDPAALARDVATFRGLGYRLSALRAYDAFPMTHHIECVALLEPGR
ncbi:MAG TPA: TRAM domain-containing protein [Micromonosporaceae bacterium]